MFDSPLKKVDKITKNNHKVLTKSSFSFPITLIILILAAQTVLHTACSKRKQVLQTTIDFCMNKLGGSECGPRETDGVLHIIGSVADALMKKKPFKDQMEQLVVEFILPSFSNDNGYIRARACWVLQNCST